jgi:protein-disulfide isomerase
MANQKPNQKRPNSASNQRPQSQPPKGNASQARAQTAQPQAKSGATQTANRPVSVPAADSGNQERKLTPRQEAARKRLAARRRNRIIVFSMIGVVAVVVIGLVLIILNQPVKFDTLPAAHTVDKDIVALSTGTPTTDRFTMGNSAAKVTLTEYGDYQCPACRQFKEGGDQDQLINEYVKTGKIKFTFANYPFLDASSTFQESHLAAEAAYCAADQNRFWDFHDALYDNQLPENSGKLTTDRLKQLASQLGLNTDTFNKCLDTHKYKTEVANSAQAATTLGVNSTPSFAVNGQLIQSANPNSRPSYDEIKAALDKALAS